MALEMNQKPLLGARELLTYSASFFLVFFGIMWAEVVTRLSRDEAAIQFRDYFAQVIGHYAPSEGWQYLLVSGLAVFAVAFIVQFILTYFDWGLYIIEGASPSFRRAFSSSWITFFTFVAAFGALNMLVGGLEVISLYGLIILFGWLFYANIELARFGVVLERLEWGP